ncbi:MULTISPECIES: DMT family transporter [unclassified Xanthobacter]|uniref:DMT family transporter n=1 Tax=unclassified Xanthobacter TaxID=2623496 RepID=UPI001EE0F185|nr:MULTISPECIES: DMT family transporter [unclassified Xanthobacter]
MTTPAQTSANLTNSGLKGVLAMAVAMGLFITNDTCLKLAVGTLPLGEAIFLRTAVSAVLLLALVARSGDLPALPLAAHPRVLGRSILDSLTTFLYVAALAVMPIASSTTIYMAAPLLTTALAVPMLGEKVSLRGWCAIVIGFSGAVIVTRPDPATFSLIALLPLIAAFCSSVRDVMTRGIGLEIPGPVVSASAVLVLLVCSGAFAIWEPWHLPALRTVLYLLLAGTAFAGGTLLLVYAFRHAPVASISPLRYLMVFGALLSGYLVFGDVPDAWTSVGIVLVVGAGLYAIRQEQVRARNARRAAACVAAGGSAMAHAAAACAAPKD